MTYCLNKNINLRSKNWVSLIKSVEMRQKRIVGPKNCNLYHYAANNPVKYSDPNGKWLINNIKLFNNYGKFETAESFALHNYDEIKKTAGSSTRLGWWPIDGKYQLLPLYSTTPGFKNDVEFSDKQTMSTLKSISSSQKENSPLINEFITAKVKTEKKDNGVIAVNLTVSRITADYKNNVLEITNPVTVTLAFTTEEELNTFRNREDALTIMAKDALQKANLDLSFGVEK